MVAVVVKDLLPQPIKVVLGSASVSAHGLDLEQTVRLMAEYKDPLAAFFSTNKMDFTMLIATAPKLVAEIIALGIDAEGQEADIRKMPVQMQIDLLTAVWEQSVPNVKNLLASLQRASASLAVAHTQALSTTSSPDSSTSSLVPAIASPT